MTALPLPDALPIFGRWSAQAEQKLSRKFVLLRWEII
jgi:hypothetical protein